MGLRELFEEPAHLQERAELPILRALIQRYATERPFLGLSVALGHLLVRNSMVMVEALWRGGADIVLSRAHPSPAEGPILDDLRRHTIAVLDVDQAARSADWFLDVGAGLGRRHVPARRRR